MGALATLPEIPTPIAPARPGGVIWGTDASGNPVMITPGTATNTVTGQTIPTAAASSSSSGGVGQMAQKALGAITKAILPWSGIDLEDTIFIVVGLILVAAAVFSFKGTQTVVQTVSRTASKAAEIAG